MYKANYSKFVEALDSRSDWYEFAHGNRFVSEKEFDSAIWQYSRNLLMDNEELLRVCGHRWITEKFENEELSVESFNSALHCIDWLFSELSLLRSAHVPGFDELNAMVLSRGPESLKARIVCHKRGGPFLEGIAKGVISLFDENLKTRMKTLNPSCSDLEIAPLAS